MFNFFVLFFIQFFLNICTNFFSGEADPGSLIEQSPTLSPEIKQRMLWDNAVEWLGVDIPVAVAAAADHDQAAQATQQP